MKKIIFILCIIICPHVLFAAKLVEINHLLYRITDSIAEVTNYTWEEGDRMDYSGEIHVPGQIYYEGRAYRVKKIGMWAFRDCQRITSVSISEGVEEIDTMAFFDCISMRSVHLPSSLRAIHVAAFSGCSQLRSVDIPDSVGYVGGAAFALCDSLQYVHFPINYVETAPHVASFFYGDVNIRHTIQTSKVLFFVPRDVEGEYIVEDGIESIAAGALQGCTRIAKVVLPSSLVTIGDGAFASCASLEDINMPNALRYVGFGAFDGCVALKQPLYNSTVFFHLPSSVGGHLVIPRGITYIRPYACAKNHHLTSVTFPRGVRCIPRSVFYGNDHLCRVRIPSSIDTIAFHRSIPLGSVKVIRNAHHFAYLQPGRKGHYKIPRGIMVIDDNAFQGCALLDSITIPVSVDSIGSYAFNDCSGLRVMSIPSSVRSLGYRVFNNCSNLVVIRMESNIPPSVGYPEMGLEEVEELELHKTDLGVHDSVSIIVPKGCINEYRSAPVWKQFNIVEE